MANTRNAPAAPAERDEELFDQAVNAPSAREFDQTSAEPAPAPEPPTEPPPRHTVPLNELLDERDRRQQAERRLQDIEAERQKQQPRPDFLMQPDEYFDRRLNEALDPLRRQVTIQLAHANKSIAVAQHGAEVVEEAQKAFDAEVQQGRLHPSDHQRIWSAPNPFAAAVDWNRNRKLLAEVGNDPQAYRDRLLQEALADPDFLGRALEAARSQAAGRPVTVAPQRQAPRASSAPATHTGRTPLPPSLNRQGPPGGQPPPLGDGADADLYEEMTNPGKLNE
jgi:hypothetical protein